MMGKNMWLLLGILLVACVLLLTCIILIRDRKKTRQTRDTAVIGADAPRDNLPVRPVDDEQVIVSLTSYPARIGTVHETIRSLLDQTFQSDAILLWLARDEFPSLEEDLPSSLLDLQGKGLTIRWCENIGPHKKYYWAMLENPDSIIVTFDDDMHYDEEAVALLYDAHLRHPTAVCARRARQIKYDENGEVAPYLEWPLGNIADRPSQDLMATGVGGVLYPPHVMSERLFDRTTLMQACPRADDLWLKTMQRIEKTPTVLSDTSFEQKPVENTQEVSLYLSNQLQGKNDEAIERIRRVFADEQTKPW